VIKFFRVVEVIASLALTFSAGWTLGYLMGMESMKQ
jgi:hypothetical protein